MLHFAAVVVTYYPDSAAISNLKLIAEACPRLFVIDNTPCRDRPAFPVLAGTTVKNLGENIGLAAALNLGVRMAGRDGFENIFLLDQDSRLPENFFADMLQFKSTNDEKTPTCALYVPNYCDRNTGTFARFTCLTRGTCRTMICTKLGEAPLRGALIAITSGTLITYSKYARIGPFREDFFIGFVDAEYCLRVWKLGFRVAANCQVTIDHAIGNRAVRKFLGLMLKPNHQSPTRKYYSARNGIRTALDYFSDFPLYLPFIAAALALEFLSIVLYETGKGRKIQALFAGISHGLTGRLGKCRHSSLCD